MSDGPIGRYLAAHSTEPTLYEAYVDSTDAAAISNVEHWDINEGVMTLFVAGGSQVILPLIHHQAIEMRPQGAS